MLTQIDLENFLLHKEHLSGFSSECSVPWRADLDWKVRRISCYIRSIWISFHLSVLWRAHSQLKVWTCHITSSLMGFGFSSECTLTCSLRLKSLENLLLHKEHLSGFSSECIVPWRADSDWKVRRISCYIRRWFGFLSHLAFDSLDVIDF